MSLSGAALLAFRDLRNNWDQVIVAAIGIGVSVAFVQGGVLLGTSLSSAVKDDVLSRLLGAGILTISPARPESNLGSATNVKVRRQRISVETGLAVLEGLPDGSSGVLVATSPMLIGGELTPAGRLANVAGVAG